MGKESWCKDGWCGSTGRGVLLYLILADNRQRWLDAFNPPKAEQDPIYADWKCPRARAIVDYDAKQVRAH